VAGLAGWLLTGVGAALPPVAPSSAVG